MARYVFITGGVVSSLGKGLASAALGALLQARGFTVRLRKLDPYLNVDPGTMSPFEHGEVFVTGMHISPYEQGNIYNQDPLRKRKLLLNRSEIRKLIGLTTQKGYSLIPLSVYLKDGLVKLELAVAIGKKQYDKRESMAKKDAERRMQRVKDY